MQEVTRWVMDHGCTFDHITGSHYIYKRPDGNIVVVPHHDSFDTGTLKSIEKQVLGDDTPAQQEEADESPDPDAPGKDETGGYRGKWLTALHCPLQNGDRVRLQQMNDRAREGPELQAIVVGGDTTAADPDKRYLDVRLKAGGSLRDGDGKSIDSSQGIWRIQPGDEAIRVKTEQRGLCPSFTQAQAGLSDQVTVRGVHVRHVIAEEVGGVQMLKVTVSARKDAEALALWRVGNTVGNKSLNIFYVKFVDARLRLEGNAPGALARFAAQNKSGPLDDVKYGPQPRKEQDIEQKSKPTVVAPDGPHLAGEATAPPGVYKPIPSRAFVHILMGRHHISAQLVSEPGSDRLGLKSFSFPVPAQLGTPAISASGEHVYWPAGMATPRISYYSSVAQFPAKHLGSIPGARAVTVNGVAATWIAFDSKDSTFSVLASRGAFDAHKPLGVSHKDGKDVYRFSAATAEVSAEFHTLSLTELGHITKGAMVSLSLGLGDTMAWLASAPGQVPTVLLSRTEIPAWRLPGLTHRSFNGIHAYLIPVECPAHILPFTFLAGGAHLTQCLTELLEDTLVMVAALEMTWSAIDPSDIRYHDFHREVTIPVLFKDQTGALDPADLGWDKLICVKMTANEEILMPEGVAVRFDEPQTGLCRYFVRRDKTAFSIPVWSINSALLGGAAFDPWGESKWEIIRSQATVPPRASVLFNMGVIRYSGQLLSEPGGDQLSLKTAKPLPIGLFGLAARHQSGSYVHEPHRMGSPAKVDETHLRPVPPTQLGSIPRDSTVQVHGVPAVWVGVDPTGKTFRILAGRGAFDGHKPLAVTRKGHQDEYRFNADAAPVKEVVYHVNMENLVLMDARSLVLIKSAGLARLDSNPGQAPTVLVTKSEVPTWNRRGISRHDHDGIHSYTLPMATPSHARASGAFSTPSSVILRRVPDATVVNVNADIHLWSDTDPGAPEFHDFHRKVTIPTLFKELAGQLTPESLGWDHLFCLHMSGKTFDFLPPGAGVKLDPAPSPVHKVFIRRDKVILSIPVWEIDTSVSSTGQGLTGAPDKDGLKWRPATPADLPPMASVVHGESIGQFDAIRIDVNQDNYVELNNQNAVMFRSGHEQGDEVSVLRGASGDPLPKNLTLEARRSRAKGRSKHATQPLKAKDYSIKLIAHPEKHGHYLMAALTVTGSLGRRKLGVGIEKGQSEHQDLLEGELIIETCRLSELFTSSKKKFLMVSGAGQPVLPAAADGKGTDGKGTDGKGTDGKGETDTGTTTSTTTTTTTA